MLRNETHKEKSALSEAEKLFEEGKHAEAVLKYETGYHAARKTQKGEIIKRVAEHYAKSGNEEEARKWIERSLTDDIEVPFESQAAKDEMEVLRGNRKNFGKKSEAWAFTQIAVTDRLKSPSTANFGGILDGQTSETCVRYLGKGVYHVNGWVDSQNGFGATVRAEFSVELKDEDGKWKFNRPLVISQR